MSLERYELFKLTFYLDENTLVNMINKINIFIRFSAHSHMHLTRAHLNYANRRNRSATTTITTTGRRQTSAYRRRLRNTSTVSHSGKTIATRRATQI